jgi:hypothetical protein
MKAASFATLINQKVLIPSPRTQYVAVDKEHLVDFLKPTLRTIYVDTEWYLFTNPDIADAIRSGAVANAVDHYITFGYYEHRMPYEIEVEEKWYLTQYPDVKDAVSKGLFPSARDHYYVVGFKEGRVPHANFALRMVDH